MALDGGSGGAPPLEDSVNLLPPELRTIILHSLVRGLTPAAARTLAATGSGALQAVLKVRTDLRSFTLHRALAPSLAQLHFSAGSGPTSKAQVRCSHGKWVLRVSLPWHAVPRVAAEQQHEAAVVPADAAVFWLSPTAMANAVEVHAAGEYGRPRRLFALPPGMGALTTLRVHKCILHGSDWLPLSSSGNIRKLAIRFTDVKRLPAGMGVLTEMRLIQCRGLAADWLPESSRPLVRILDLGGCDTIASVPAGMLSLECITISYCDSLATDWLPESSRAKVRVVMGDGALQHLSTGLHALQYVSVCTCNQLAADWLPQSSTASLRIVDASCSNIESLPEGMCFLEAVRVYGCKHLAAHWLPASSAQRVRFVDARYSNMQRLPSGMTALAAVAVTRCTDLAANWLPDSSAADVRQLGGVTDPATQDTLQQGDRSALQTLLPPRCWPSHQVRNAAAAGHYCSMEYAPIVFCPTLEPLVRSLQPEGENS